MREPTEKQRRIAEFYRAYELERGEPPTLEECASVVGCSKENIRLHLLMMEKKGIVERTGNRRRAWRAVMP